VLKILVWGIDEIPHDVVMNVEKAFDMIQLSRDVVERSFISSIDKGTYFNSTQFTDRFGVNLYMSELSTGCKAALSVYHNPTTPINCTEMGTNAVSAVIKYCKNGIIVLPCMPYAFNTLDAEDIDVEYLGTRYTSFQEFANFMYYDWPGDVEVEDV